MDAKNLPIHPTLKNFNGEMREAFAFAVCDIAKELQTHEITQDNFRGLVRFECSQWLKKHRQRYTKPTRQTFYETMLHVFSDMYGFDTETR